MSATMKRVMFSSGLLVLCAAWTLLVLENAASFSVHMITHMAVVAGAAPLLALSPRPLYGDGFVTCFGTTLSAGEDQQVGGVVMLMVGAAVYLAGGVTLLARTLNAPSPSGLKEG